MTRTLQLTLVLLALTFSTSPRAALIDNQSYTTDDVSGLDWLDLTATVGLSVADALASNAGWALATIDQFQDLFYQFETLDDGLFFDQPTSAEERIASGVTFHDQANSNFADNRWFDLFGLTLVENGLERDRFFSYGWYNAGGNQRLGGVLVSDWFAADRIDEARTFDAYDLDYSPTDSFSFVHPAWGSFLVRATNVPEPSIIALFAAGLLGLGIARRRRA